MDFDGSVLVVGAALIVLPGAASAQGYDDLVDSVLLGQLVANKRSETVAGINWYDTYVSVLDDFWFRGEKSRTQVTIAPDSIESLADWVIAAMPEDSRSEVDRAAAILRRLAAVSDSDPAMHLLRSHMHKRAVAGQVDKAGSLLAQEQAQAVHMLVIVAHSPTSAASMYLEFKSTGHAALNPLSQLFNAQAIQGPVCLRYARSRLFESHYSLVRETVALKVQDRIADNVALMKLPAMPVPV
ncbi:hypothetical protein [Pseudomonas sp.]|uniref:hypothetical protein n=1 Tax=Pseudomonas sp. TaxID=306 RepID=UPI002E34F5AD|nr:hypothetical protein [Pseudomonas sp.]HEX4551318.1 hypothetical protein [Pseudomonas sp.]